MSTHINSLLSRKGVKMNRDKPFNNLKELPPNSNIGNYRYFEASKQI